MAEELRRLRIERTRQLEREGRKAIGFYREGGKTRPITKKKARKTRVVKKVVAKVVPEPRFKVGQFVVPREPGSKCEYGGVFTNEWVGEVTEYPSSRFRGPIDPRIVRVKYAAGTEDTGDARWGAVDEWLVDVDEIMVRTIRFPLPMDFGWKLAWGQRKGSNRYEVLWTKGEQYLGVARQETPGNIRFDVLWGNDDTGDLDCVRERFNNVSEAVAFAEKWIVDREKS